MAPIIFARDKLGNTLSTLLDEYEAMLILLAQMNSATKRHIDSHRKSIRSLKKSKLLQAVADTKARIKVLRTDTGATLPVGGYTKLLASNLVPADKVIMLPANVAVVLFEKYPRVAEALRQHELPFHTHIELDSHGRYTPQSQFQFHILEASLFEDMCAYWNEACSIEIPNQRPHAAKRQLKQLAALHRAAVSAAFYMVEAYCNGLAFEALSIREAELSDRERELITERCANGDRPKYASIRDKILHYPRILMGVSTPLIQESNCQDLEYFLSAAKKYRDAVVHASPRVDHESLISEKVQLYFRLDHAECANILDSAIGLVFSMAAATDRSKCLFWLQRRLPDGRFDESVFN